MNDEGTTIPQAPEMKLELVPVPVTDIDRAKAFYVEKVGFNVDVDIQPTDTVRFVQLTPPGSACSICIGTGIFDIENMQPGSIKALHLVVGNIYKAREALMDRGIEISEVEDIGRGVKYAYFKDPDGNAWALQEMPWRSGDFKDA